MVIIIIFSCQRRRPLHSRGRWKEVSMANSVSRIGIEKLPWLIVTDGIQAPCARSHPVASRSSPSRAAVSRYHPGARRSTICTRNCWARCRCSISYKCSSSITVTVTRQHSPRNNSGKHPLLPPRQPILEAVSALRHALAATECANAL